MPMSLRKRAEIHLASKTAKAEQQNIGRTRSQSSPASKQSATICSEDAGAYQAIPMPAKPEAARKVPSRSLLERYKGRSPAAKLPKLNTTISPRRKKSAFVERFGEDMLPISPGGEPVTPGKTSAVENMATALSMSPAGAPTIVHYGRKTSIVEDAGDEQAKIVHDTESNNSARGQSAEAARSRAGSQESEDFPFRRTTRSQTRQQERKVSVSSYETPEKRKDSGAAPDVPSDHGLLWTPPPHQRKLSDEIGLALTTPPSHSPPPSPLGLRAGAQSRAGERDESDPGYESDTDTDTNNATSIPSSTDAILSQTPLHYLHTSPTPLRPHPSSPSHYAVPVVPPMPNVFEFPGFQWLSASMACSRPEYMWSRSKRWMCCRCGAKTIVEQGVCARLECAHGRCGRRCRVDRSSKASV